MKRLVEEQRKREEEQQARTPIMPALEEDQRTLPQNVSTFTTAIYDDADDDLPGTDTKDLTEEPLPNGEADPSGVAATEHTEQKASVPGTMATANISKLLVPGNLAQSAADY